MARPSLRPALDRVPFVLSALDGLHHHLPRMPAYHERARALAAALAGVPGVAVAPAVPQCNAFQLYLPHAAALEAAHLDLARDSRVWLFGSFAPTALPGLAMAEVSIGDAAEDLTDDEVMLLLARLLAAAGQSG